MPVPRAIPVLVLFAAAACGPNDAPATPAMAVVRTFPELEPTGTPLFLNQRIRVEFSRPVDRLSVTKDTIRVTDASGLAVSGRLSIGTQSVAFRRCRRRSRTAA
jgi:hypothetical protein